MTLFENTSSNKDNKLKYLIYLRKELTSIQYLDIVALILLWNYAAHFIFYIFLVLSIFNYFLIADKINKLEKESEVIE